MRTGNIVLTKEAIEIKYKILSERINIIYNLLKILPTTTNLERDIKNIKIIQKQYNKMYYQLLKTGEYQKYEEIENIIIEKLAKIEFKLDKEIHHLAKLNDIKFQFECVFGRIRECKNYREFHDLDEELEKIKWIKELLKRYIPYISEQEREMLKNEIIKFKFELLIRRQVEQMVYRNGGISSNLKRFDSEEERKLFESLLGQLISKLRKDDIIKQRFNASQIMSDNILLNHVVFKIFEQEIEKTPNLFKELLNAPVFNPHLCNIANNPYNKKIAYAKKNYTDYSYYGFSRKDNFHDDYLERNKINLSVLLAVLNGAINDENTTILACGKIYKRFGFNCRPVVINEGQEIIRQIFNKTRFVNELSPYRSTTSKGKWCSLRLSPCNYEFDPKEESFLTNAEILQMLNDKDSEKATKYFEEIYSLMGKQNLTRKEQEELVRRRE